MGKTKQPAGNYGLPAVPGKRGGVVKYRGFVPLLRSKKMSWLKYGEMLQ
ncbi:hypothetical protein IIB79_02285 [candidate division KSB1 bacterium]|nr:hypothetical protein [candidate division KSB1 bacterium]